jgi:glycosyltransferase involved in cell wall biosynthesis
MISIIVPAYNAAATLSACLDALAHQTLPAASYEVIVVDDGSTDGTARLASRPGVRLVRRTHAGPAAARNSGIRAASGEIVLFTDADCEPEPGWVAAITAPFADPEVAGCKGTYRTRQRALVARFVQAEYEDRYRHLAKADRPDFIDTYSAAYRMSVLTEDGGFDESIPVPSVEDAELSFRLSERGRKLAFAQQAIVYHRHPVSVWRYARRKFRYGRWRVPVYARYPAKLRGDAHTPEILRAQLALVGLMAPALAWAALAGSSWAFPTVLALAFALTTLPFTWRTLWRDPAAALVAPVMCAVRAVALALGLAVGLGTLGRERSHGRVGKGQAHAGRPI